MVRSKAASCQGGRKLDSNYVDVPENPGALAPVDVKSEQLSLRDPRAVLSLLEADQVVAAKRRTHFGLSSHPSRALAPSQPPAQQLKIPRHSAKLSSARKSSAGKPTNHGIRQ